MTNYKLMWAALVTLFFFIILVSADITIGGSKSSRVIHLFSSADTGRKPYWTGYDNSTQSFWNTANAQVINISNNRDYDAYLINISGGQNISFQESGDYQCTLSPQFFQNGGGSLVTFWYQKCVSGVCTDKAWSNSRYSMTNNEYHAPAIIFQFDIETPSTEYVRFMWWSDSTSTQIYSSGVLTAPARPSIPGILLTCLKVSELTP